MNRMTVTIGIAFFSLFATMGCNSDQAKNQNASVEHHQNAHTPAEDNNTHSTSTEAVSQSDVASEPEAVQHPASDQQVSVDLTQGEPSKTIPSFTFYKVKSGISFNNQDIGKGRKTAFILFDPSCSHCRTEANALGKNYDKLKDINIYFVSMNDPSLMASFLETFAKELVNKPNVEVLYDRNQEFIQKFHVPKQFPANYVYSKDGQLETFWDGDKNINDIVAAYTK